MPLSHAEPASPVPWLERRGTVWLLSGFVFLYGFLLRAIGLDQHFWLLGDQIRDWSIALGELEELPLVGPSSVAGGYLIGPSFYWFLWLSRVLLGSFFENLPHTGALAIAALHAGADALLFRALWVRLGSVTLALAPVVLLISGPYDLSLATAMWAPIWAVAFTKLGVALLLLYGMSGSAWLVGTAVGASWLALHGHLGPIYVVGPSVAWPLIQSLRLDGWRRRVSWVAGSVLVPIAIAQVPFVVHLLTRSAIDTSPTKVLESLASVLTGQNAFRLAESYRALTSTIDFILLDPPLAGVTAVLLPLAALLVLVRSRREPVLLFVTILPLCGAWLGMAAWQGGDLQ